MDIRKYQNAIVLYLRLATALNFLSPVADRFGLWGPAGARDVVWGNWSNFVIYTAQVNSLAPATLAPALAIVATGLEIAIPILLIVGWHTRLAAVAAGLLTLVFGISMTLAFGFKSPTNYAVWVDSSSAFLLACATRYRWSLDEQLERKLGQATASR